MVTVSISETYDLSTKVNKMTLIAIHTPKTQLIAKTYPGLAMSYKYFRIKSVDCRLVAVSHLPISPDQVGNDVNKISPQDMLNPILYKAVSNDSWSTLEARLAGLTKRSSEGMVFGNMAVAENDDSINVGVGNDFGVYYSLLSNRDGFRIAHPQQGLAMRRLTPLVFEKWYNHAENVGPAMDMGYDIERGAESGDPVIRSQYGASGLRGRPHRMPRINTTYLTSRYPASAGNVLGTDVQSNGMGDGTPANAQISMPDVPPVMLAGIIIPPAKQTVMYYRMTVRAFIEFTEIRPITDVINFGSMDVQYAPLVYHSDYVEQSKSMDTVTDMVDVKDGDIEKIMEGR